MVPCRVKEATIEGQGTRRRYTLTLRGRPSVLGERTWVMGVLNVTPDSLHGGHASTSIAVEHGLRMFADGADVVDVGGESTRPGAAPISEAEERKRVVPVIAAIRSANAGLLSIDTSKADVARAALDAGADLVNDVSALSFDPTLARVVADEGVPVILMHLRGDFGGMHRAPRYANVMSEVIAELAAAVERALQAGVRREQVIVDPGIGFAKDAGHSLEVLRRLGDLRSLDRPLLVGPSRKSFIGKVLDRPVEDRLMGTAAAVAASVLGGAHVVRVHDVTPMRDVTRLCDAILGASVPAPAAEARAWA